MQSPSLHGGSSLSGATVTQLCPHAQSWPCRRKRSKAPRPRRDSSLQYMPLVGAALAESRGVPRRVLLSRHLTAHRSPTAKMGILSENEVLGLFPQKPMVSNKQEGQVGYVLEVLRLEKTLGGKIINHTQ